MKKRFWTAGAAAITLVLGFAAWKVAAQRPVVVAVYAEPSATWSGGQTLLSPDGRKIWLGSREKDNTPYGGAAIWDLDNRRKLCKTPNLSYSAWSHDSKNLALASDDNREIILVNAHSGAIQKLRDDATRAANASDWNQAITFSPDDHEVRLVGLKQLRRFNRKKGRVTVTNLPRRSTDGSEGGEFAPDGDLIFYDSRGASQWEIVANGGIKRRPLHLPAHTGSRFSRDGKWVACWFFDGSVHLFQTKNWRPLWTIPKEKSFLEFSSDGREVYVSESEETFKRYNTQTGQEIGDGPPIFNAIASPDGRYLYEARGGKIWRWPAPAPAQ